MSNPFKNEQLSRIIVGVSLLLLTIFAIYLGGWFLSIVLIFTFWHVNTEFLNIVRLKGINPSNKWIRFVSILFFLTASLPLAGIPIRLVMKLYTFIFVFGVVGCFFRLIFRGSKDKPIASIPDIGASVLGFIYTGLLPSFLILTRELGIVYAFIVIISTAFCDTGAYYGGKFFGKTKLQPKISSKKTFEGALIGFLLSMTASILIVYFNKEYFGNNLFHGVMIGLFTGIFSQFGDLFESLLKRDAGVKDSGNILFSHGGILDRIDSYIFVTWAVYFYINWIVLNNFWS